MNKWQAIQDFWESFGLPAYAVNAPEGAPMPYITYTPTVGRFESPIPIRGDLWYKSTSLRDISLKVDEILASVTPRKLIKVGNNQYIHLVKGSPEADTVPDPDTTIQHKYVNLMAEFYTYY